MKNHVRLLAGYCLHLCLMNAQSTSPSAQQEVEKLSNRSNPTGRASCGIDNRNRLIASTIADLGKVSLPFLEKVLSDLETAGVKSRYFMNARWVYIAFARIQGPSSFGRLRQLMNTTEHHQESLDDAVALALGITSYVSARSREPAGRTCNRVGEPRFAMNRIALGCQQADLSMIQSALSDKGKAALAALLRTKTLRQVMDRSGKITPGVDAAVGFKFSAPDEFSEPIEPLKAPQILQQPFQTSDEMTPIRMLTESMPMTLSALLFDRLGNRCKTIVIQFSENPSFSINSPILYLIDDTNLDDLLGRLAYCSSKH